MFAVFYMQGCVMILQKCIKIFRKKFFVCRDLMKKGFSRFCEAVQSPKFYDEDEKIDWDYYQAFNL